MDHETLQKAIWLIPLLPMAGFVVNVFVGKQLPKPVVGLIACGTVLGSAILSWLAFGYVRQHAHDAGFIALTTESITWINIPGLGPNGALKVVADLKLVVDQLTCVMILVVTNVGFLIHVYSTGYMAEEKRYSRYFCYLNLFTSFMLFLVMAGNALLMFVGWEGVGLCSYLLISFWYEKIENAKAGMKAFIVNRIGDFAFTIGVMLLFVYLGQTYDTWTLDFGEIKQTIAANRASIVDDPNQLRLITAVCILLFIGATGKSAQIPLFTWLPDAMAGPTPVSALIHAATMVTAGVYMVARMNFIFALSPVAMTVVAVTGAITAIFAGTIGLAQNDIKKVLAYSTVSQLGFMFMGVGVGAFAAGIFHLMTHAFFKACLFLGSGSVIHGMGGEQDIRKMGGLRKYMPVTFWTFMVASFAIAGFPLLAGFWSKDEILWKAFSTHALVIPGPLIWICGFVAAGFTAFYMMRLCVLTFFGELRSAPQAHAHSGGGVDLPDWMNDEEKRKDDEKKEESQPSTPEPVPEPVPEPAAAPESAAAPHHDEPAAPAPHHEEPAAAKHDDHAVHAAHADAAPSAHDAHGKHAGTPHESPVSMTGVLAALAVLSLIGGFIGMPHWIPGGGVFEKWLEPVCPEVHEKVTAEAPAPVHGGEHKEGEHAGPSGAELGLMAASVAVGLAGLFFGWHVYATKKGEPAREFTSRHRELHELVRDKYRVDELYDAIVVEPLLETNEMLARFDNAVIDGAVNGTASGGATVSNYTGYFDNEVVDGGVNATAYAVQSAGRGARSLQTGNIKTYIITALVGGLIVIGAYCLAIKWNEILGFISGRGPA